MVATRRKKSSQSSQKDVASREPNILQMCSLYFGHPGIPPSEVSRPHLKRRMEALSSGDPFYDEQEFQGSPKRRKVKSFPIGPLKDVHLNALPPTGKSTPPKRSQRTLDSSPAAVKAKRRREGKSKRLITADGSTNIGRLELFSWDADYRENCSSLAATKNGNRNTSKKSRETAASRLIFGKGIADVGVWLGKSTTGPAHAFTRQFSGDSLLDGVLDIQKPKTPETPETPETPKTPNTTTTTKVVALCHQNLLQQRTPSRTPPNCNTPQTPTKKVTLYDDKTKNCNVGITSRRYYGKEPVTPVRQLGSPKRPREDSEEASEPPCTPTTPPRKRSKKTPSPPPTPTVVTRSMRRKMEARGVYLNLVALP